MHDLEFRAEAVCLAYPQPPRITNLGSGPGIWRTCVFAADGGN